VESRKKPAPCAHQQYISAFRQKKEQFEQPQYRQPSAGGTQGGVASQMHEFLPRLWQRVKIDRPIYRQIYLLAVAEFEGAEYWTRLSTL
jgi:hypothetical protein